MGVHLDDAAWTEFMNALIIGSIEGMHTISNQLNAAAPGKYPPVDDSHMFDAALLLVAALIDANPEYADAKRFRKAADMVRSTVLEYARQTRQRSEAQGRPILYSQIEAAIGRSAVVNDL